LDGILHAHGRGGFDGIVGIFHGAICDLRKTSASSIIDPAMAMTRIPGVIGVTRVARNERISAQIAMRIHFR